jgi:dTDP-4-dehydrorhamnose 3,5-epimerase
MELTPLGIEGAWLAKSPLLSDDRGYFREWFKQEEVLSKTQIDFSVQQANLSSSGKAVIRGIHYSLAPEGQAKWVTCVRGSIIDVIVDIRPNSPTFKKVVYVALNEMEGKSVLIGPGLGHGFISIEDRSTISYLLSSPYAPDVEFGIHPFDSDLNIEWGNFSSAATLSTKDSNSPTLNQLWLLKKLPDRYK